MYFIILTTALTLHKHGIKDIETSKQAAEALRPLAGTFAYCSNRRHHRRRLSRHSDACRLHSLRLRGDIFVERSIGRAFRGARPFYAVLIVSILLGIAMDYLNINPVKALFWTAIINGVLAPFLLVGILIVASDSKLMQGQPSSWLSRITVGIITLAMFGAAAAMFVL
jgi:Mn2+/Fe2+ NRAMP family transporter